MPVWLMCLSRSSPPFLKEVSLIYLLWWLRKKKIKKKSDKYIIVFRVISSHFQRGRLGMARNFPLPGCTQGLESPAVHSG